ncbi:MAG TPA: 6-phosphofructokinase [Clostridiales bacterium]|jgi:6-phosphofructokinase 1|nr:6-phosphofructokinase [Clostridiales bacterium]
MKSIGVLTSGGDAPGMNAAIRAVVRTAVYHKITVYGIERGYDGLLHGDLAEMGVSSVSDIIQRGGTILRTARCEAFKTPKGMKRALEMLDYFDIEGLIVIGGDGSFRGAQELAQRGIKVVGVPGTIDNDLPYTVATIGFDTAVNTVLSAISHIRDTSSSHDRSTVIEVMGRASGEIARAAGLAGGAEFILTPEEPSDINAICRKIIQGKNRGKLHSIVIRAEGSEIPLDELVQQIKDRTEFDTKAVVLGYVQRGGSPTAQDRLLASRMGYHAVELLKNGKYNRACGTTGADIFDIDLAEALEKTRQVDPQSRVIADVLSI